MRGPHRRGLRHTRWVFSLHTVCGRPRVHRVGILHSDVLILQRNVGCGHLEEFRVFVLFVNRLGGWRDGRRGMAGGERVEQGHGDIIRRSVRNHRQTKSGVIDTSHTALHRPHDTTRDRTMCEGKRVD